jgi:hypothetical protein
MHPMSEGQNDPDEIYTFSAAVAQRWGNGQIQITPDDWDAFVAFIDRTGITTDINWHPDRLVTVSRRELLARVEGAQRVRYSVRAKTTRRGREMWAVDIEPIQ